MEFGRDVDAPRPVLDVVGERRAQAEVVERRRAELPHELVDVAIDLPGDRFERLDEAARGPAYPPHASLSAPMPRLSAVSCSPN